MKNQIWKKYFCTITRKINSVNIFWHELRSYRRSTFIWSISLALLVILFLSLFPSFSQDINASQKILANLPLALREALGISLSNFFTIFGFFSYLFTFVTLAGAIQAMNLGVGIISKEYNGKTADFLFTKPINRSAVVTQKLLAAVCSLLITNVAFMTAAFATAFVVSTKSFDMTTLFLIAMSLFLIQLIFLALGNLLSVVIPRIRSVISITLPTVFAFFIIGSIGAIVGNDTVKYLTPFKFYDPSYIVQNNHYETRFVILEVAVVVLAVVMTYVLFNKKDVRSAT